MLRLKKAGAVKRVVATVFEPASEHGQKGMDELHEQTVNLLSFQQLPKKVFDTQVAFNMVTRYGEQSVPALNTVEHRVLKHYQRIAGKDAPALSLLLVQAPIFTDTRSPCMSKWKGRSRSIPSPKLWPGSM